MRCAKFIEKLCSQKWYRVCLDSLSQNKFCLGAIRNVGYVIYFIHDMYLWPYLAHWYCLESAVTARHYCQAKFQCSSCTAFLVVVLFAIQQTSVCYYSPFLMAATALKDASRGYNIWRELLLVLMSKSQKIYCEARYKVLAREAKQVINFHYENLG